MKKDVRLSDIHAVGPSHRTKSGILLPPSDAGHRVTYVPTSVPGLSWHALEQPEDFRQRWLAFMDSHAEEFTFVDPVHGEDHVLLRAAIPCVLGVFTGFAQRVRPKAERIQ